MTRPTPVKPTPASTSPRKPAYVRATTFLPPMTMVAVRTIAERTGRAQSAIIAEMTQAGAVETAKKYLQAFAITPDPTKSEDQT
jgi:hypothetical protein